jgi:hypothetical protein
MRSKLVFIVIVSHYHLKNILAYNIQYTTYESVMYYSKGPGVNFINLFFSVTDKGEKWAIVPVSLFTLV